MRILLALMFLAPIAAMAAAHAGTERILPLMIAMSLAALIGQTAIEIRARR